MFYRAFRTFVSKTRRKMTRLEDKLLMILGEDPKHIVFDVYSIGVGIGIISEVSYQRYHLRGVIVEVSYWRYHTRGVTSEVSYQRCHVRDVISEVSHQRCHINGVISEVSY